MKRSIGIALWFLLLVNGVLNAQPINWSAVSEPDPIYIPRSLYYSENLELTVFCGAFLASPSNYYVAGYNGDTWQSISDTGFISVYCAADYLNGVLIGGQKVSDSPDIKRLGFYDGENWSFPWEFTGGSVTQLVWTNDTLFALGNFTEIDGAPVYNIAKLSGDVWLPMLLPDEENITFPFLNDIEYFEGHYYVGGNFHSIGEGVDDFGRLENMQVVEVGEGLFGAYTNVNDLQVYQGELYIAGKIAYAEGNVGNHLVRWNGQEFLGFDSHFFFSEGIYDLTGEVDNMFIDDEYLLCTGNFHFVGDIPMSYAVRYDGSQWCGLWGSSFNSSGNPYLYVSGMFQDKLMIMRNFVYEDDSYDPFWIFEGGDEVEVCSEPLSLQTSEQSFPLTLYPNPASDQIRLTYPINQSGVADLFNLQGKLIKTWKLTSNDQTLDVASIPRGMYILSVRSPDGVGNVKLVLE